jgi:hypothetical protein
MEWVNLNETIEKYFGPFCDDKVRTDFMQAALTDIKSFDKTDKEWIISTYNSIFGKKSRIISGAVNKKYNTVLKSFSRDELERAMKAAKEDDFHKANNYKYCTLEYFSRVDQVDKWLNASVETKREQFVLPKFNIKQ